jgi:peptide/nickel transport system permease protein
MKGTTMKFALQRMSFYLITAWAALTLNFFLPRLMPGNPAAAALSSEQNTLPPQALKALTAAFGLRTSEGLLGQYGRYLADIFQGQLGISTSYFPAPVWSVIRAALPWTIGLVGVGTVLAFLIGTALGVVAGWRRGTAWELVVPVGTFLTAMAYFWFGLILVAFFGLKLGWLPFAGGYDAQDTVGLNGQFIGSVLSHAILPALTIVVPALGGWALGMRNMMSTVMGEDYVLMARAKGLRPWRVTWQYAARNAILPNISGFALSLGFVVSGAIGVEVVFSYPGIGYVLYHAVTSNDYPLMQGIFLVIVLAVLIANLIADFIYLLLDPRTRHAA